MEVQSIKLVVLFTDGTRKEFDSLSDMDAEVPYEEKVAIEKYMEAYSE